ncbi:hypothetical protein PFISCL1PPCAC_14784, partial [Pristionchus fissidentatus]
STDYMYSCSTLRRDLRHRRDCCRIHWPSKPSISLKNPRSPWEHTLRRSFHIEVSLHRCTDYCPTFSGKWECRDSLRTALRPGHTTHTK